MKPHRGQCGSSLNRSYTSNGLNQYTASGSVGPTYDARGNLTSAGATTYGYTSENLLVTKSGADIANYDGLLRLSRIGSSGQPVTKFNYDGTALIGEYDGSTDGLLRRYVHGPGTDEPIVWYEGSGTSDRRFLHSDERGSVIAVSDSSGATIATNAYDEYGIPSRAMPAVSNIPARPGSPSSACTTTRPASTRPTWAGSFSRTRSATATA